VNLALADDWETSPLRIDIDGTSGRYMRHAYGGTSRSGPPARPAMRPDYGKNELGPTFITRFALRLDR
jgi:hypothetical protein